MPRGGSKLASAPFFIRDDSGRLNVAMFREAIRNAIEAAVLRLQTEGKLPQVSIPPFSVAAPEHPHGDYAANVALLLAHAAGETPIAIARAIAEQLHETGSQFIERAEAAAPGFVNITVADSELIKQLGQAPASTAPFSFAGRWSGKNVMAEFTDPNPFKEFHIGHLYTNIVGETLCRLFEAGGATVKRANYQGDVGLHVAKAVWGMQQLMASERVAFADLAARTLDDRVQFMGRAYALGARAYEETEQQKSEITLLNKKIFARDPDIKELYEAGRAWSLEYFERMYRRLGSRFDFYYLESVVGPAGLELVQSFLSKGIFEQSEGAVIFPGEKYGLHRRVFITSEGLPTYEAKELGLAPIKHRDFPYDLSLIITGSEITDYFKVLFAALKEIYPDLASKNRHIPHGMVRLASGKMSSRTGDVIRAEDLLDDMKVRALAIMRAAEQKKTSANQEETAERIAVGAVKYAFLKVGIGKDIIFDPDASLSLEGDSGPYLQYTYARLKSILRKSGIAEESSMVPPGVQLDSLEHRLLVSALRLPEVAADALEGIAPQGIAAYLHHLAKLANEFYHSHPVMQEPDPAAKTLRVAIVSVVAATLAKGLLLLGIDALEEM